NACLGWASCGTSAKSPPTSSRCSPPPRNLPRSPRSAERPCSARLVAAGQAACPLRAYSGTGEPHQRGLNASVGCIRSEEHTSELQSLAYLVCRLLLEKKKKKNTHYQIRHKSYTQHALRGTKSI